MFITIVFYREYRILETKIKQYDTNIKNMDNFKQVLDNGDILSSKIYGRSYFFVYLTDDTYRKKEIVSKLTYIIWENFSKFHVVLCQSFWFWLHKENINRTRKILSMLQNSSGIINVNYKNIYILKSFNLLIEELINPFDEV